MVNKIYLFCFLLEIDSCRAELCTFLSLVKFCRTGPAADSAGKPSPIRLKYIYFLQFSAQDSSYAEISGTRFKEVLQFAFGANFYIKITKVTIILG
jgi:hypothetical protein